MRITRHVLGVAALAFTLGGTISSAQAGKDHLGLTLGGHVATMVGGGLIYGPDLGFRTEPVDFMAEAFWAGASGVSISLYRLNVNFNLGDFFIGPSIALATITISFPGFTPISASGLAFGAALGYNFWLSKAFALTPITHVLLASGYPLIDVGAQLTFTL